MPPAATIHDKLNNIDRNYELDTEEFTFTFKGSMRSVTDTILDLLTLSWPDPGQVIDEVRADKRLVLTGKNTRRGFGRIHISEVEPYKSDAATVEGILGGMKSNHRIADFARALVAEDAMEFEDYDGQKHYMKTYYLPGTFTLRLTKEYLEAADPQLFIADQETRFLANHGLGPAIFKHSMPGLMVLALPQGKTGLEGLVETINMFNAMDEVRFATLTRVGVNEQRVYPSETQYSNDYSAMKACKVVLTSGYDAWNHASLGGVPGISQVKVVVIDTGVWNTHTDLGTTEGGTLALENRGTKDWDFANDGDGVPLDESADSHGTAICGVIGAQSQGWGAVGVAPKCKIIPLRVDMAVDDMGTYVERADAIHYITSNVSFTDKWGKTRGIGQARLAANAGYRYIINLSWQMTGPSPDIQDAIADAAGAGNDGVLVIASAGNNPSGGAGVDITQSPVYPACYANVIPVGSVDTGGLKPFTCNFGNTVLFAPEAHFTTLKNDETLSVAGSSISTAFVSGVAALTWSANYKKNANTFTKDSLDIRGILILEGNTTPALPSNLTLAQKIGRVDAYKCVAGA
ncbi:MAG TPA: S8/S53 family peptidase [Nitrososphaera sp.]|jgi:hypothetical protein|nr:S8/S53 family peptidase [Nitrososphaera sp.]